MAGRVEQNRTGALLLVLELKESATDETEEITTTTAAV
jgi:hypothetical protein